MTTQEPRTGVQVEPLSEEEERELRQITEEVGPGMTDWLSSGRTLQLLATLDAERADHELTLAALQSAARIANENGPALASKSGSETVLPVVREGLDCPAYVRTLEFDIDQLSGWALRYALGRMTYAVSMVAEAIVRNIDILSEQTLRVMLSDIEEATAKGNLGMDTDAKVWSDLAESIAARLNEDARHGK